MPLLAIFQLYHSGQCYWYRSPEYHKKTTDLLQATNTHNNIITGHFALKPYINQKFCFENMQKVNRNLRIKCYVFISECPMGIMGVPDLPDMMSCHYTETCTGIECCVKIPEIDLTLHPFLFIDPCEYTINYGVNTINKIIKLIDYEWGR